MSVITQFRGFTHPVQLLLLNQLTINIGFYMLMPYLAAHLSGKLALATWLVGLILGIRNFSQQGMFLIGGALADRFGYKPLIVAGCVLRTGGFALLGVAQNVPALVIASGATGFAGALFNPAVRAYLAEDAAERRVEAFALFSVFYQAGILIGPLIGLALTGISFELTCLVAAGVFALLTALQITSLPQRVRAPHNTGSTDNTGSARVSVLSQWRRIATDRAFVLFSVAMIGSYVLSYQVYLALPLQARRITGDTRGATLAVAALFAVSALVTIAAQLRITAWCRTRWTPARCIATGLIIMATAFVPPAAVARVEPSHPSKAVVILHLGTLVASAALLALGNAIVFPFEMDTVVALSQDRLVATYYGFYNTICGVGIMIGNLATGGALDSGRALGFPELPWLALALIGLLCASAITALGTRNLLPHHTPTTAAAVARR